MSDIAIEAVALLVECPVCMAGEVLTDGAEACWEVDGSRELPTPHPERVKHAADLLAAAERMLA